MSLIAHLLAGIGGRVLAALATSGQVAAAKVGDNLNATAFCEQGRCTNLNAETKFRVVANGLPVAANRQYLLGLQLLAAQQVIDAPGGKLSPGAAGKTGLTDLVMTWRA